MRPILARGEEPFQHIMKAKASLQAGQKLVLTAPFEPVPLFRIFQESGFNVESTPAGNGVWRIAFEPMDAASPTGRREMDLRELEPPEPLQRTLETLSELGREESLTIHTRFRPVHLLDQLDSLGFEGESEEVGKNHWTTHIWRLPPD